MMELKTALNIIINFVDDEIIGLHKYLDSLDKSDVKYIIGDSKLADLMKAKFHLLCSRIL